MKKNTVTAWAFHDGQRKVSDSEAHSENVLQEILRGWEQVKLKFSVNVQ